MTTAPLSLTSTMRFGKQASKGNAATTGFLCGRYVRSELASIYEYIEAQGEHHCGINIRPTLRKSLSRAGGYTVPFGAQGFLYPDTLGMYLLGLGFGIATTPPNANEIQQVAIANATDGTFTLSYTNVHDPVTTEETSALAHDISAANLAIALKALTNLADTEVTVTGAGTPADPFLVEFVGALAAHNIDPLVANITSLIGIGASVTITEGDPNPSAYTHSGTIASRAAAKWLTVLHSYGEGADLFTLRATDARIEQLVIEASTRGVMATVAGIGIKEDAATGAETGVSENEAMLLPSKGACTINIEGEAFTSSVRGLRFLISNPTDKNEQNLFSLERSDLPSTGIECGFSAMGLDVSYDVYRKLKWHGVAGTGPNVQSVSGDITFNFQSAELIGAVPYQFTVAIPRCEFRMGPFRAQGRELVRFDLAGLMVDDENSFANPITVALTNGVATY